MARLARWLVVPWLGVCLAALVIYLDGRYVARLEIQVGKQGRQDASEPDRLTNLPGDELAEKLALESLSNGGPAAGAGQRVDLLPWRADAIVEMAERVRQRDGDAWPSEPGILGPGESLAAGSLQPAPDGADSNAKAMAEASSTRAGTTVAGASATTAAQGIRPAALFEQSSAVAKSLQNVEPIELMRLLRSDDEQVVGQARAELLRRGFNEVDLELARQLLDPDPEIRKRLARSVTRLQSVDAEPWLLWLSGDENAEVRMTAITLLATAGDPQLLEKVEAAARQDSDPRIRELADQIAQQRGLAGSRGEPGKPRPVAQ